MLISLKAKLVKITYDIFPRTFRIIQIAILPLRRHILFYFIVQVEENSHTLLPYFVTRDIYGKA